MKTPNIKVLGARMVVLPSPLEEKTKGGIVLPTASQEENHTGTVVVVGEGQRFSNGTTFPMSVNVGDKVLYMRTTGVPVEYDGTSYMVINEAHILAIFPQEDANGN